ncbi:MAG: methionyl-tRNA formyltransferase [Actinobacteria bacterium]|nr:MAG: methionyl-tRNA formyltransferase [Actinomycetota bacterium]
MAVFLGTPAAAVPALAAFSDVVDVDLVVTRPDRPKGRRRTLVPPPVKVAAEEWGMPVAQPASRAELLGVMEAAAPEVALVVAYGRILSPDVIATSTLGFLNVHFSLLPRWRGAAPVERAILEGDETTGVSLMLIDQGLDSGPVLAVIETPIGEDETGGSLTARLSYLGAKMVDDIVPEFMAGRVVPAPQFSGGVTEAPPLSREEARIDGSWDADRAARAVRAFRPRPGAWVDIDGEAVKIHGAARSDADVEPGIVVAIAGTPFLGLEQGALELARVQAPGKQPVSGREWMNGRRGEPGRVRPAG